MKPVEISWEDDEYYDVYSYLGTDQDSIVRSFKSKYNEDIPHDILPPPSNSRFMKIRKLSSETHGNHLVPLPPSPSRKTTPSAPDRFYTGSGNLSRIERQAAVSRLTRPKGVSRNRFTGNPFQRTSGGRRAVEDKLSSTSLQLPILQG